MSYRPLDNSSFRNQNMSRPKGRPPFNNKQHGCEPMPSVGRPRFIAPLQGMQQQPQYPPAYARSPQYPGEYATVQYAQSVPAWSPITMAETYQHAYPQQQQQQQQQQQVYSAEATHMIAIAPNSPYIAQVQSQNDFDPLANVSICPKCNFVNSLALVKLRALAEENKKLHEQLSSMEQQLAAAGYEEEGGPPFHPPQQQVSSLSVDAQPFQMEARPRQAASTVAPAADRPAEPTADRSPAHNNNNGRDWSTSRDTTTPVVSASDVGRATDADTEWDETPAEDRLADSSEPSDRRPAATEPPNVSANAEWAAGETAPTAADSAPLPRDGEEASQQGRGHRARDQRQRPSGGRPRGGRNDSQDSSRDGDASRRNFNNRRESGGSNAGVYHRNLSPQDQKDRRAEASASGSRDSSRGRPKPTGPEQTDSTEVKRHDSGDRGSPSDSAERGGHPPPHSRPFYQGDSQYRRGGGRGGGKGRGSDGDVNWRDSSARSGGNRGGNGPRKGSARGGNNAKAVVEKDGDLFTSPPNYSLAHCVAEDLRMGSGIAVNFRQQFKQVDELLDQRKRVGEVAVLEDKGRYIYYLVTKRRSSGKPMWGDFAAAVEELRGLCVASGVKNLAMPRIGCGLDRLQWPDVRRLLEETFGDSGVTVTAYNYQQNEETERVKPSLYVVHQRKDLVDIDPETGLIFLCSEDGAGTNRTLDSLDKKHKMAYELRSAKRAVGDVVTIQKGREYLYGLVVRKSERDALSYVELGKCLRKLRSVNGKDKYGYFGVEAFRVDRDPLAMEKLVTVVRNTFGKVNYKLEFHICWPKELEGDNTCWDDLGPK